MIDPHKCHRFQPGDLVRIEVEGDWIDGEYEGFAEGAGHVVRTKATVVVIAEQQRLSDPRASMNCFPV